MSDIECVIRATSPTSANQHFLSPELKALTLDGWVVVERFDVDENMILTEQIPAPPQNGYTPPPSIVTREQLGKQSYFRLRKSGETIVSELSGELDQLKRTRENDLQALRKSHEEEKKLLKEIEQVRASLKSSTESNEATRKQKEQIEQIKRQLEGDIGKIREHIGKKMMSEILGEGKG